MMIITGMIISLINRYGLHTWQTFVVLLIFNSVLNIKACMCTT